MAKADITIATGGGHAGVQTVVFIAVVAVIALFARVQDTVAAGLFTAAVRAAAVAVDGVAVVADLFTRHHAVAAHGRAAAWRAYALPPLFGGAGDVAPVASLLVSVVTALVALHLAVAAGGHRRESVVASGGA